jgi:anthranilate synthase component 2
MSVKPHIVIFDNYDSFTYNLVHLVEQLQGQKVTVVRNNQRPLEYFADFDKIILSPGPGIPEEAGLLLPLIREYAASKSILGVCLGHQAIGEAMGGKLINLDQVYHGLATPIQVVHRTKIAAQHPAASGVDLFAGLPDQITVGRYHSWVVDRKTLPDTLRITAEDEQGLIMAMEHKTYDVKGVQFHPESILTPDGLAMMRNWLNDKA